MWLVKHLTTGGNAELFEGRFQTVQSIFESLSPDASLAPHLDDYKRLVEIRTLWATRKARLANAADTFDLREFQPKTHKLVQDSIARVELQTDLPVYEIDGDYLRKLDESGLSGAAIGADMEAAIEYEIRQRGGDSNPLARSLKERLEELLRHKDEENEQLVLHLRDFVSDIAAEKEAKDQHGLTERGGEVFALLKEQARTGTDEQELVTASKELDAIIESHAQFDGWQERGDVLREIRQQVMLLLAEEADLRPLLGGPFVDDLLALMTRHVVKIDLV